MNEQNKRRHEEAVYSRNAEDETEASLLKVRELLSSLPKESCPAGFEYRLNRRLKGIDERPRQESKSWTSGWIGVGMGFAAAAVIALFAFDFNGSDELKPASIANSSEEVTPVNPANPDNNAVTQIDESGEAPATQDHNLANTDSAVQQNDPTYVSPDRLQRVSGSGK